MIWDVDPVARIFIDVAIWGPGAALMFALSARFDVWLRRMGVRPYWKVRRPEEWQSYYSGASTPLLDR
jgi:hypothetical protein